MHGDDALPPGEDGLSAIALHLQVGRGLLHWQALEPDQAATGVKDHRPCLPGTAIGSGKDVSRSGSRRAGAHRDRRRVQVGARAKALDFSASPAMDALGRGADRVANGDREAVEQGARRAGALDRGTHLYPLAFGEAARRQEARAIAVRVREQATCVAARTRADDADVRELARRDAEEADLRLRGGVATAQER